MDTSLDVSMCFERVRAAVAVNDAPETTMWYFRTMLRARQDAWCTHEPDSAYGAVKRVSRKLMRAMRPLSSTPSAHAVDVARVQADQMEWLRALDVGTLPSPVALVTTYSDAAVGYVCKRQRVARHRRPYGCHRHHHHHHSDRKRRKLVAAGSRLSEGEAEAGLANSDNDADNDDDDDDDGVSTIDWLSSRGPPPPLPLPLSRLPPLPPSSTTSTRHRGRDDGGDDDDDGDDDDGDDDVGDDDDVDNDDDGDEVPVRLRMYPPEQWAERRAEFVREGMRVVAVATTRRVSSAHRSSGKMIRSTFDGECGMFELVARRRRRRRKRVKLNGADDGDDDVSDAADTADIGASALHSASLLCLHEDDDDDE